MVTTNRARQLLCVSYIGVVTLQDLLDCRNDIATQAAELKSGYRLLVDLTHLKDMDAECMAEVGRNMEVIDQHGVDLVVRVIPDVCKDIGMNILTIFHYRHRPRIVTCESMEEAGKALLL